MDEQYYRRQVKGLILILEDSEGKGAMISREYVIEKLRMILDDGINFHQCISRALDLEVD